MDVFKLNDQRWALKTLLQNMVQINYGGKWIFETWFERVFSQIATVVIFELYPIGRQLHLKQSFFLQKYKKKQLFKKVLSQKK